MKVVAEVLLGVAGIIHLLPMVGMFGTSRIERLYGISVDGPDLALLMRHRAVLFGLLGILLFAAIWDDDLRVAAVIGGLSSDLAFLGIAAAHRGINEAMRRVVVVDVVSVFALIFAAVAIVVSR